MNRGRKGSLKRTLFSTLMIFFGVIICSVTSFIAVDYTCRSEIDLWLPVYPDAELVSTDNAGFVRLRASGITEQTYYTSDSAADVRVWYTNYRREITQGQYNTGNANSAMSPNMATVNRIINEDPNSDGTIITYYSECAYG
ncbi:MAG: hypothetical protein Phog2KO_10050 [Phototrophicaceae bacterium]